MKSSVKITKNQVDQEIPMLIYDSNTCFEFPDAYFSRYIYNGPSGGEVCFLPEVEDIGKELVFTNVTTNSMIKSVNSGAFYNIIYEGIGTEVSSFPAKSWFRIRVMVYSGSPYLLILEKGLIS